MNKFDVLLESAFNRFQGGGFLTGDLVKFKPSALGTDWAKKQPENLFQKLKEFTETDENIRISAVKALRPAVSGSVQQHSQVDDFYCDIVREKAPGLFMDFITVPAEILEYQDMGINLPDVPDSQKRDEDITLTPEELKQKEETESYTYKQTGVNEGDKNMDTENNTLDHTPSPTDNFTTKVYMQGH